MMLPVTGFGTYRVKDIDVIRTALSVGYQHIDTAELYKNEHLVKQAIDEIDKTKRKIFITTKISKKSIYSGRIRESWDQRLNIFGSIDLMLLHVPSKDPLKDWTIFCELYQKNIHQVQWIGVSNYEIQDLEKLKDCPIKPMYNQIEISPFCTNHRLIEYCNQNQIRIIAHTSLTNGSRFNDQALMDQAHGLGVSVPNLMLSWARNQGFHVIPKSISVVHMCENLHNLILSDDCISTLNQLDSDLRFIKIVR
jgi:diketogulonate reductase-like aldo/keto reductase